jgi:hypothetical protein
MLNDLDAASAKSARRRSRSRHRRPSRPSPSSSSQTQAARVCGLSADRQQRGGRGHQDARLRDGLERGVPGSSVARRVKPLRSHQVLALPAVWCWRDRVSELCPRAVRRELNDTETSLKQAARPRGEVLRAGPRSVDDHVGDVREPQRPARGKLGESGPKGLGTLLNLRDAYAEAGRTPPSSTTRSTARLTALRNQDSATERGAEQLREWGINADGSAKRRKRLADAARQLETTTGNSGDRASGLLTSQASLPPRRNGCGRPAPPSPTKAPSRPAGSAREERNLAEAVESASQRIVDAQQHVIDARQKVADAQEKLARPESTNGSRCRTPRTRSTPRNGS